MKCIGIYITELIRSVTTGINKYSKKNVNIET